MRSGTRNPVGSLTGIVFASGEQPIFHPGDQVRILTCAPIGHYRVPIYLRGKKGTVESVIEPAGIDNEEEGYAPIEAFDQLRAAVQADRSQFWKDLSLPFYGYNMAGAKVSEGVRKSFWLQGMMAGLPASYFCIKAFSETDLTADLGRFDGPTLVLHGDDDQIVPNGASAMRSSKLIKNATLKVYKGAPHGMCTTLKDKVNADLLEFLKS